MSIKGSASECVLVSLLSARNCALRKLKSEHPFVEDGHLLSRLVMYTSKLVNFYEFLASYFTINYNLRLIRVLKKLE